MPTRYPRLRDRDVIAYDTETTGLLFPVDRVFGFSISFEDKDYYYDVRKTPKAVEWINDEMAGYDGLVVCHNASFDWRMSAISGIHLPINALDDTAIRACLIDEHLPSYTLDDLSLRYLGRGKVDIYQELADLFGGRPTRNAQMQNLHRAPSALVGQYAKGDSRNTLDLWRWQEAEIIKQSLEQVCAFERGIMPTILRTELKGVRVDLDEAERAAAELTPIIGAEQAWLDENVYPGFNSNSAKQMREALEPELIDGEWYVGDEQIGTTDSGAPSLKAEFLRKLSHPIASHVLELRSLIKTRDTFLLGHILGHQVAGRVYPTINQLKNERGGTGPGRFSYVEPALQQIPSRNKRVAAICKKCFLPDEGHKWLDSDMDSFEVRVFAHLVNESAIIQAYAENPELDLHGWVAGQTNLPRNAEYSGQANAKQLNLSAIFNSGDGSIAAQMGMPWSWASFEDRKGKTVRYRKPGREAREIIARYHRRIPGVKKLAEGCKRTAERRGYIRTFNGRHIRFPRGWKSYKASGLLIQSTSAELNKENWVLIENALDGEGRLVLNTHDSYGLSVPEDYGPIWQRVKESVEHEGRIRVPLILQLSGVGLNWWDAISD